MPSNAIVFSLDRVAAGFNPALPPSVGWTLRLLDEVSESLSVRDAVLQPVVTERSRGAMITVAEGGGLGYGGTSDLSPQGLARALDEARGWARLSARHMLPGADQLPLPNARVEHDNLGRRAWSEWALGDKIALLHELDSAMMRNERIVDRQASLSYRLADTLLVTSAGGRIRQRQSFLAPMLLAAANSGGETQRRTWGFERGAQGGLETLDLAALPGHAARIAEEALQLLSAPDCPSGKTDLLLLPNQMVLQIHESIGHPIELDRILGDERNYAGTTFVTPGMFGTYRYGSELLNVTFDPARPAQLASYAFDDEGTPARREYIIRDGILLRGLGGVTSQARSGLPGVANARACDWNRPPIDRMAILNVEPGNRTFDQLVRGIERGVLMDTNRSWSIDDSRVKFQFGCEAGRVIENGELRGLVKNPNYRGISGEFWRSLHAVGDESTFEVMGEPTCGKGEPNQMIHVGHASPACVFTGVEVFGGA
jgi:predicted Zn-dependent protease